MSETLTQQYEIRDIRPDDAEAVMAIHANTWRETYVNEDIGVTEEWLTDQTESWTSEESVEFLRAEIERGEDFHRLAFSDGELVGIIQLSTIDDTTKLMKKLFTTKPTHGTGLAQQLMSSADEWIGDADVGLEMVTYNDRAKAFYKKYGFEVILGSESTFLDKIPTIKMIRKGDNS